MDNVLNPEEKVSQTNSESGVADGAFQHVKGEDSSLKLSARAKELDSLSGNTKSPLKRKAALLHRAFTFCISYWPLYVIMWRKGGISKIICTDIADLSVKQCEQRYKEMKRKSRNEWVFEAEFLTADSTKELLSEKYNDPEIKFDI
ncbi:hypothetical protein XELAEV_18033572mg [Xenopus laevis]|uniref:mRNA (guanine-N(7))-methyltransferase n=1 Tax=Xenopus laevis TaxID=8355 RepID=A0A974CJU7_XENLA|nr:hypothetical protein XELAEV_18033572mg [Xenopus laevis]